MSNVDVFRNFDKFFVGFDDHYNRLAKLHDDLAKNIPGYPPYNIKKVAEDKYTIEVAIAGFNKSNIDIIMDDDKLIVKGMTTDNNDDQQEYLFKGIANRNFTRMFALSEHVEVQNAEVVNGMLRIFLEKIVPEHRKPKKIEIKD